MTLYIIYSIASILIYPPCCICLYRFTVYTGGGNRDLSMLNTPTLSIPLIDIALQSYTYNNIFIFNSHPSHSMEYILYTIVSRSCPY